MFFASGEERSLCDKGKARGRCSVQLSVSEGRQVSTQNASKMISAVKLHTLSSPSRNTAAGPQPGRVWVGLSASEREASPWGHSEPLRGPSTASRKPPPPTRLLTEQDRAIGGKPGQRDPAFSHPLRSPVPRAEQNSSRTRNSECWSPEGLKSGPGRPSEEI